MSDSSLFSKLQPEEVPALPRGGFSLAFFRRLSPIGRFFLRFRWLILAIVAVGWYLRARNPHYSSAYMDESIYVLYGRMFLSRHFEAPIDHPLNFSFGWYLWPMLAAWADRIAGLVGVRELGAALGAISAWSVYGFARRVFSAPVGWASALVFAFLGPAIFVARVATRDVASLCFFALGLWLFAKAWQDDHWLSWFAAAFAMFASFLCKYLIAIYFPFFVILTLWRRRRGIYAYSVLLTILCVAYAIYFRESLVALWQYGRSYTSLKAPASMAWQIYFSHRPDFWILVALALLAWLSDVKVSRRMIVLLYGGTAVMALFQFMSRADYDYWKHINYCFLFLVPLAMQGLLAVLRRIAPAGRAVSGTIVVSALAVGLGWMGNAWHIDRFVFWPNTEPIAAYFQGRLSANDYVLIDDTALRYYFSPSLYQWQIVDPFYFRYGSETGAPAYSAATRDGSFDYIVLDGGIGGDAKDLRAAIEPQLSNHYTLVESMPDPTLEHPIEIYARKNPPPSLPAPSAAQIAIESPAANAVVRTENTSTTLTGMVRGIQPGDYVRVDVFTNKWYSQGGEIRPGAPVGAFEQSIYLGGEGREQCFHIVRARLLDPTGRLLATAANFNVARLNADGTPPSCR
ncbi:MAG TPA: glycosyltransferase family 39 protein [Candidatus Acidoferrales bacterium]|nr:glycosyltransferase family 39 protein [Candidatus Acidoferrales bacterium]